MGGGSSSHLLPQSENPISGVTKPTLHKSVIFVIGAPGSGKEKFCSQLAEKYDIKYLSLENLLTHQGKSLGEASSESMVAYLGMSILNSVQTEFIM